VSGWLYLAAMILVTVVGQLAFKQYFRSGRWLFLPVAVVLFCLAVLGTYLAARQLGIGRVYVGAALTYVLTPLAANRAFGEYLGRTQYVALGLIVAGVVTYNL
jgi:multidrug transporter EmrE-like cation transporter